MRVPSTRMCGFNQSELIFLIWIIVVFNHISASFLKNSYIKDVSNWNQSSILDIVVSNHKNDHFCSSCRIQSEESLLFKGLNLPNK